MERLVTDRDHQHIEDAMNDDVERRVDERSATARIPAVFEQAFLSGIEGVTQLLLVRHGQQEYDVKAPIGDMVDPPLSELGRSQARLVGMALSTERIDHVYASPLRRALDTGQEIARHHRLDVTVLPDLREVQIFRDIPQDQRPTDYLGAQLLGGIRNRMLNEKSWDVYPHSESSHDFRKRIINVIEGIIIAHPGERVVVACHGGVINAYVGHVIGSKYDMFFQPAHTSINLVAGGEGRRAMHYLNNTQHLFTAEGSFHSA
jgi:broad specificity phosphatase PhoE